MNGTLETIDGRPALRFERRLAHPVQRVWRAVTEPRELERWFPGAAEWKPEAGEVFEAGGSAGEIIELRAPHLIAWAFGGELFRFEPHLAGELLSEEQAHEPIGELHERYARRFGLDPAPGRAFIAALGFRGLTLEDGPVLRLERRYRHPVERLWRALIDPGELAHWFPSDAPMTVAHSEPPHLLVASWPLVHERYAETFGVDPDLGRRPTPSTR